MTTIRIAIIDYARLRRTESRRRQSSRLRMVCGVWFWR